MSQGQISEIMTGYLTAVCSGGTSRRLQGSINLSCPVNEVYSTSMDLELLSRTHLLKKNLSSNVFKKCVSILSKKHSEKTEGQHITSVNAQLARKQSIKSRVVKVPN